MASNHTEHFSLNQWLPDDQVKRTDFNEDNAKLDAALNDLSGGLAEKADQTALDALAAEVAKKATTAALEAVRAAVPEAGGRVLHREWVLWTIPPAHPGFHSHVGPSPKVCCGPVKRRRPPLSLSDPGYDQQQQPSVRQLHHGHKKHGHMVGKPGLLVRRQRLRADEPSGFRVCLLCGWIRGKNVPRPKSGDVLLYHNLGMIQIRWCQAHQ